MFFKVMFANIFLVFFMLGPGLEAIALVIVLNHFFRVVDAINFRLVVNNIGLFDEWVRDVVSF